MTIMALDIIAVIEQQLAVVQVTNGYYTNAGLHVYRGRSQFDARIDPDTHQPIDPFPLFSIKFDPIRPAAIALRPRYRPEDARSREAEIQINGAAVYEGDHPQDIGHQLLADIWRAVKLERPVPGSKDLEPDEGLVSDPDPESGLVIVSQTYLVTFHQSFGEG